MYTHSVLIKAFTAIGKLNNTYKIQLGGRCYEHLCTSMACPMGSIYRMSRLPP